MTELLDQLHRLGLTQGDNLIVHSAFRPLKPFVKDPDDAIGMLLRCIGPTGNLMLPTFNYSSPPPEPCYDLAHTPARTGALPECARKRADAVRSEHPTHSVAVIGPDARALTQGHLQGRAFGVNSPIGRLAQRGGKVLLIGVGQTANSTIHVAEEHAGIFKPPKRDPLPMVKVRLADGTIVEHQLDTSPSCSAAFDAAAYPLRQQNLIRDGRLGDCAFQLMPARSLIAVIADLLAQHPDILRCTNSHCTTCHPRRSKM